MANKIYIRRVKKHYILCQKDTDIEKATPSIQNTLFKWEIACGCVEAVIATCKGKLVGFFRYTDGRHNELRASGTYVDPRYRGKNLGIRMWSTALQCRKPKFVRVVTTSRGGRKLVGRLKQKFPKINFVHSHSR